MQGGADGDDGDGPARAQRGHHDTAVRRRLRGRVLRPQLQDAAQTGNLTHLYSTETCRFKMLRKLAMSNDSAKMLHTFN